MDTFRADVVSYLSSTSGSTFERKQALSDLALRGFFHAYDEQVARDLVQTYLKENPQGFCDLGIKKFREALKLVAPIPERSPVSPKAINLADLKIGDEFIAYHKKPKRADGARYVFLGESNEKALLGGYSSLQIKVMRINDRPGRFNTGIEWIYATDYGLMPYGNAKSKREWNSSNHCEFVNPEPVPLLAEADPEIEKLLEEEEAIERSMQTPRFRPGPGD